MKFSHTAKQYVELAYGKKVGEINTWYEGERVRSTNQFAARGLSQSGLADGAMANLQVERIRRLVDARGQLYVEAYERDGKDLDEEDVQQICEEISRTTDHAWRGILETDSQAAKLAGSIEDRCVSTVASARRDLLMELQRAKLARSKPLASASKQPDAVNFSFVQNQGIREILERDYKELSQLDCATTPKAVLVMSGGIIEGLLLDALVSSGKWTFQEGCQRFLKDMIGPARSRDIISEDRLTTAVRKYRDLIHPAREIREKMKFSDSDATLARSAVDVTIREISEWQAREAKQKISL